MKSKDLSDLRKAIMMELEVPHPGRVKHAYYRGVLEMIDCALILSSSFAVTDASTLFDRLESALKDESQCTQDYMSHDEKYNLKQLTSKS